MFFRKNAKPPPFPPELVSRRSKTLIGLESDLHAAGWDKCPKYYHVLEYLGEDIVVLKDEIHEKPISYLMGRTFVLGVDKDVVGCALAFEGWALPDGVIPQPGLEPNEHPDRRATRIVTAEFLDGMSVSVQRFQDNDEVRVVNSATDSPKMTARGPLVDAMRFSVGAVAEPGPDVLRVVEGEMREFITERMGGMDRLLDDDRYRALYEDLTKLINANADNGKLEACIRGHAKNMDIGEDELIALAKFTGLI